MNDNLDTLNQKYIGRAIIIGKSKGGIPFATYILTGRSDPSKSRTLKFDDRCGVTYAAPTDMKILEEGSSMLLLYPAIMMAGEGIAISNGSQTNLIYNEIRKFYLGSLSPENKLYNSLNNSFFEHDSKLGLVDITCFEPDKPNYTPRISGCIIDDFGALTIARRNKNGNVKKEYFSIMINSLKGTKLIMTYDGIDTGKKPLQSFTGKPLDLILTGETEEEISSKVREAINPDTFIAVATQFAVGGRKPYIINLHGGE